jgi:hypothetical protein
MFRFSSGLSLFGGNENGQGYLIYESFNQNASFFTQSEAFDSHQTLQGKRKWNLTQKGELKSTQKPLIDGIFDQLINDLNHFNPKNIHPALEAGFQTELLRLFPQVDQGVVEIYQNFISFLTDEFDLKQKISGDDVLKVYTDDLGPCLVSLLDGNYIFPPEIPPLYFAPKEWRILTWWINNYFSGPYPENTHPEILKALKGERFDWGGLQISENYKNKHTEGLVYFLLAKFMIIYEAWMFDDNGSKLAKSLVDYIDLIQNKNHRPWQILY